MSKTEIGLYLMAVAILFIVLPSILSLFKRKKKRRFFNNKEKNILWRKYDEKCGICSIKCEPYSGEWNSAEYDHIRPFAKLGETILNNGMLLCKECNMIKGARYDTPSNIKKFVLERKKNIKNKKD